MSERTSIEWTDTTWNPVRGCSRVSEGCRNCYAEMIAARFSKHIDEIPGPSVGQVSGAFHGFAEMTKSGPRWTGRVELITEKLDEPLRWRKPRRVFVNSMSDLFHEALPDEAIAAVFGVMAAAPQHTFQVLTKRPVRMRTWMEWASGLSRDGLGTRAEILAKLRHCSAAAGAAPDLFPYDVHWGGMDWPPPNVWLGVSVEDQATADERIPILLSTPAAVRFVSAEPLLGPIDLSRFESWRGDVVHDALTGVVRNNMGGHFPPTEDTCERLDWVIVGGESGPGARRCEVAWIRSLLSQCKDASVPCFVKQVGSNPWLEPGEFELRRKQPGYVPLHDRKGGDMGEWPENLRVREFPEVAGA